jgi:ATP-dependent DNA ligase
MQHSLDTGGHSDSIPHRIGVFAEAGDKYRVLGGARVDAPPTDESWVYAVVYSPKDARPRGWQIGFDAATNSVVSAHGLIGGAIQSSAAAGVKNARASAAEAAVTVANAKFKNKTVKEGYLVEPPAASAAAAPPAAAASASAAAAPPFPMLAQERDDAKTEKCLPAFAQPKFDGVRALARLADDGSVEMFSRNRLRLAHLEHIYGPPLAALLAELPPGAVVDGEMVAVRGESDVEDFDATVSIVRRTVTAISDAEAATLRMRVFTYINPGGALDARWGRTHDERRRHLDFAMGQAAQPRLLYVQALRVRTLADVKAAHDLYVSRGHEGAVLYPLDGVYTPNKRSLIKVKVFRTEEGTVVGVVGCKGGRETDAARVVIRIWDGKEVTMRPACSIARRREWFANPEMIVGKEMTFKFQGLTAHGLPRFPVALEIRDYE